MIGHILIDVHDAVQNYIIIVTSAGGKRYRVIYKHGTCTNANK